MIVRDSTKASGEKKTELDYIKTEIKDRKAFRIAVVKKQIFNSCKVVSVLHCFSEAKYDPQLHR